MPLAAPNVTTGQLCRQYLALRRQIDSRPLASYFQVPTDLILKRDQLRNAILIRQGKHEGLK